MRYNFTIVNDEDISTPILKIYATVEEATEIVDSIERVCAYGFRYTFLTA